MTDMRCTVSLGSFSLTRTVNRMNVGWLAFFLNVYYCLSSKYYTFLPPLCLTYLTEQDFFHDKNGKKLMPPKSCYLNIFQMSLFFWVITNSTKWDLKANKICLIKERISNAYQASGISKLTIIEYSKIFVHFKFSYKNRV